MILGMLWLAHYNSEIDWKIEEVKMTMWEIVEAKTRKVRMAKTKRRRKKRRSRKEARRERREKEEKTKEGRNSRSKECSKIIGDLEQERRSGKVKRGN